VTRRDWSADIGGSNEQDAVADAKGVVTVCDPMYSGAADDLGYWGCFHRA